jgi:hydrogenase expression/formation protein HypE
MRSLNRPLLPGKLPNELLGKFLSELPFDPSMLIPPAVGEDVTAVNIEGEEVLILKSDPITFASDSIGFYAVLINANDLACSGARPRWLLTTLLLPVGTTGRQALAVLAELKQVCADRDIALCGGHTEVTDAVTRPVVVGMLAGTVTREDLVDKRAMNTNDRVLLSKGVAVEGTALIAREFPGLLTEKGLSKEEIQGCREFLSRLSILKEAELAARHLGVTALHDVTEGGLATALQELGTAGGHRIRVNMEQIPIFAQTRKVCAALGLDPLGLIGSGSLLICCAPETSAELIEKIEKSGIEATDIGEVGEAGTGIEAFRDGTPVDWPQFETDELTRLFTAYTA